MKAAEVSHLDFIFPRPGKYQDADETQITRDTNDLVLLADKPCFLEPTVRTLAQRTKQPFGPEIIDSLSCSFFYKFCRCITFTTHLCALAKNTKPVAEH